jgi:hemerythrin-like domain-containing protein
MKATTLLQRQHRNLQQLCEALERGSDSIRKSLFLQLAGDLAAHIAVEEHVFYPWVSRTLRDDKSPRIARTRHALAREALERAAASEVESNDFTEAMTDLRKVIDAHAHEQETTIFPQLERLVPATALRDLAQTMMRLYDAEVEIPYPSSRAPSLYPPPREAAP